MDLTDKKTIKELLTRYGAKAEKKFGQHFILSKKALAKMIAAAEIKKGDTIIEIGPGLGTLTQELAKTGAKIIAIEKALLMLDILKETLIGYKNVKIIRADARQISISHPTGDHLKGGDFQFSKKYKVVANLPYNVATFLIHRWLEEGAVAPSLKLRRARPETMVLMIQKEVAQRICSKPPRMSLLAASVQFYAETKIIGYVSAATFWPRPKVASAIIKIIPKNTQESAVLPAIASKAAFFRVVKAGFSQPRKQLAGNLVKKLNIPKEKILSILKKLAIPEFARAENLSVDNWLKITGELEKS